MKPRFFQPILAASLFLIAGSQAPVRAQQAPPDVGGVLQQQGHPFYKALDKLYLGFQKPLPSPSDLWRLMDRLEAERKAHPIRAVLPSDQEAWEANSEQWDAYRGVAGAIAEAGGEPDFKRLLQIYEGLSVESNLHGTFLDALSRLWIKRELARLSRATLQPVQLAALPANLALPLPLKDAAPDLKDAWRLYKSVTSPFETEFMPSATARPGQLKATIDAQASWPAFYKVIGDFFGGRATDTVARLSAFEWSGGCGTGSDQLYGPKYRVLFMALWEQKRYDRALGALMAAANYQRFGLTTSQDHWAQPFISAVGVPWQNLYAGAILDGRYQTEPLAAHGSEEGASLLAQMGSLPSMAARDDYLKAVAAFVAPRPFHDGSLPQMVAGLRLSSEPSASPALQLRLLSILHSAMRPKAGYQNLETTSGLLKELRRGESALVLKQALALPYERVRRNAFEALQEMGEKVAEPPVLGPVEFRVLLNGQPLQNTQLGWDLQTGQEQGIGSISSGGQTDAQGLLLLPRDDMVDTQRKKASLTLTSPLLKSPEQAYIDASAPLPADLDSRTDVAVSTQTLELKVTSLLPAAPNARMTVLLKREGQHYGSLSFAPASEPLSLPLNRPVLFSALQTGRYRVEVLSPGTARWESQDLTLGAQPLSIAATLSKGADLRFEIAAPGVEARDKYLRQPEHTLSSEDNSFVSYLYYDYLTQTYHGLPLGRYTLKIKGSGPPAAGHVASPPPPAYRGTERTFSIDNASPPLLDLGSIALRPAAT